MKPQANRTPSIVFACLAIPFGIVLLLLTPPMQVPDEGNHFFRAFQVSEGVWIPKKVDNLGRPGEPATVTGGDMPYGVARLYKRYEVLILDWEQRVWIKMPWENLKEAAQIEIQPQRRLFLAFSNTAAYSPLPYFPQAMGIDVARLFSKSVQLCFYAARLANLLVCVFLIFLAIRITPVFPWLFAFLALSPMALFEIASVSSDAVIISICFLFIAAMLRWAFGPEPYITREGWIGLFLLAAAIGLIKQVYIPLVLLYLLIPVTKVGSRSRYWLLLGCLGLTMVAAAGAWGLAAGRTYSPVLFYADPRAQLDFILHNPGAFARVLIRNVVEPDALPSLWAWTPLLRYAEQYIGYVGHVDTPLPIWFLCLHAAVLVFVASFDVSPNSAAIGLRARLLCLALWLLIGILTATIGYLTWTEVGARRVIIQGRYFIPIGPLLFLCLYDVGRRFPQALARVNKALPFFTIIYVPISLCIVAWVLYLRYYGVR
jgi:uncharacterized membrane protein